MTIKGRLLSSITILKRFQAEYCELFKSPPEFQAPLPLEFFLM